ncbi:unnamed protein product [Zymoseptoria tritici ST99CH_3D1]|nr:unnamed protein product [Zymoseptoria tritici ST99CH_3D1]
MSITTEIYHLQEIPKYAIEKPYTMRQTIDPAHDLEPQGIVRKEEVLEDIHIYRRPVMNATGYLASERPKHSSSDWPTQGALDMVHCSPLRSALGEPLLNFEWGLHIVLSRIMLLQSIASQEKA